METSLELLALLIALGVALSVRPWRLLQRTALLTPLLASLTFLPLMWALPRLHAMPLQLHLSGACLLVLLLGWPLAVPVLVAVALLSGLLAPAPWEVLIANAFWLGVLPATLALGVGALIRRYVGTQVFVYTLGRGFLTTVACTFAASVMAEWAGYGLPNTEADLVTIAHWLIAWGEGFATGLLSAIFVAFRPQWLATWSDDLYLGKQP